MEQMIKAIEKSSPKHTDMIKQHLAIKLSGMQDRINIGGPSFAAESNPQGNNFSFQDSWDTQTSEPPKTPRQSHRTEHGKN